MKVVHKTNATWIVEVNEAQVVVLSDMNKSLMRINLFNLKSVKDTAKRQDKKKYWEVLTPEIVGHGCMKDMLSTKLALDILSLVSLK